MTINRTKEWFELAVANPTQDNKNVQLGVHCEEFSEMLDSISSPTHETLLLETNRMVKLLASALKKDKTIQVVVNDKLELLDSLCDQIVTATGVAHMNGFDIISALEEVNKSNFSKFKDGVPQFDINGKISKNLDTYFKPDLSKFV